MGVPKKTQGNQEQKLPPREIARRARLRYVSDSEPGFHRRRCGCGFTYHSPSGQRVTQNRHLERFNSLAIPPTECRALRGSALFQYENSHGWQPLTSHDVNEYLGSISEGITAKVFRTWHGSKTAAEFLFHSDPPRSISARKKLISQAIQLAAEHLGNTPTICRKYYVHPQVTQRFLEGQFAEIFADFSPRRRKRFTKADQILLRILDDERCGANTE